ncbi:hypothetical protein LCGC14_0875100 [marine sediment metagenome]|uniref:C4-dicarboxylate transporter/malic acid transport protein n=1 Tax=marine sediment metagenome TaxID=412755 RepID=A0A0F9PP83_9ZZZZ
MIINRESIGKIPANLAGLGLGVACLGTVFLNFNILFAYILSGIAVIILCIYLLKIVINISAFKNDLQHPLFSAIIPTFTMGMMTLSTSLGRMLFEAGRIMWILAVIFHILLLINFLRNILKEFQFQNILPSYFIPPVGIVVACVSGGIFNFPFICETLFYFGFISYFITLTLVILRLRLGNIPIPKKPTLAILAAPASLCLAGYLSLSSVPNPVIISILVPLSIIMTITVYVMFFKLLRIPFNPGYSAYTFPMAISAVAMLKFTDYLKNLGNTWSIIIEIFAIFEVYIATVIVVYVGIRYLLFYIKM